MRSRRVVAVALLVLFLARCGAKESAARTAGAGSDSGDIILITIDTWRADAAGFAGNSGVRTPFLDSIASRAIVFTNAHAHNVVTLPSHTNILTGLYPYQHGVRENAGFVLDEKQVTIAERLRQKGYSTAAFVAAYPLDRRFGLNRGFDVYDDNYGKGKATLDFSIQERPASAVLEAASSWWRSTTTRPRFMWIHLYDPHAPYAPPEPFASDYRNNRYLGEVAAVDAALQQHLQPLLVDDPTLIITSDHGEGLGDHGELTHGLFAYEATLKVPLLVLRHGVPPRRETSFVRHIDIVPTILACAGMTAPELPGQSLLGSLQARDTYFEALSSSLNRGWAPLTGVIQGDAKFIDLPLAELYDLGDDPGETKNLYRERRREVAAARGVLAKLDLVPQRERTITPEETARLRSLGYVAGADSSRGTPTEADDPKNLVSLDNRMHEVIDRYERGDTAGALRIAREVVAERPEMAAGRELLAVMLQQSEQIGEAINVLGRLAAEGKASDAARVQLGLLLTETGRAADAAAILGPMASGDNTDVLNGYGIALADQKRTREAVEQFRRALQLDPNNAPAYQNLGILALRANDLRSAEEHLSRALALNPRLPLALNTIGVVYARRNDLARAVEMWKRATAIDPRQYDALYNIGLVQMQTGNRADARSALEQFVRSAPPARYEADIANARRALAALR